MVENRFEKHKYIVIPLVLVFLVLLLELSLSAYQFLRYKQDLKPYFVTPILRPIVRLFVKDDYVPRTLSMYSWPWDYKTNRARPGHYENALDSKFPPYTINSFGLRGPEFQIPKPKGVYRIVVYGGSSTFGSESSDHETYPAQLEKILREKLQNQKIEVLNYGAHSKSLYWIAQQYFQEIDKLEPDLVIINNIRNTWFDQIQKWTPYSDIVTPQKAYLVKANLFLADNLLIYRFLKRSIEELQLKKVVEQNTHNEKEKLFADVGLINTVLPEFFNKLYPDIIEGIYLDSKKRAAKLMLIMEPVWCDQDKKLSSTCMLGNVSDGQPAYYQNFREALEKIKSTHSDLLVLDPVKEMIQQATNSTHAIFFDELHLTSYGNTKLAESIASKIMEEKLIK